jgi:hypothetical protein
MSEHADCGECSGLIDTSKPHVTYNRHIETERRGIVKVRDAAGCPGRTRSTEPAGSSRPELATTTD